MYKSSHIDIKRKSAFQTIAIEWYKVPKKKRAEKQHLLLVISSIRVSVVVKTDDEVYVLSIMKMYSYFSLVFSAVPKKVQLLELLKVM